MRIYEILIKSRKLLHTKMDFLRRLARKYRLGRTRNEDSDKKYIKESNNGRHYSGDKLYGTDMHIKRGW